MPKKFAVTDAMRALATVLDACPRVRERLQKFGKLIISTKEHDENEEQSSDDERKKRKVDKKYKPVLPNFANLVINKEELGPWLLEMAKGKDNHPISIPQTKFVLGDLLARNGRKVSSLMLHLFAWDVKRLCRKVREARGKWYIKRPQDE